MILIWILGALGAALLFGVFLWGLNRFCLRLEERGWIYYGTKPQGGGGLRGAMMELEALVHPNLVHLIESQDAVLEKRKDDEQGEKTLQRRIAEPNRWAKVSCQCGTRSECRCDGT